MYVWPGFLSVSAPYPTVVAFWTKQPRRPLRRKVLCVLLAVDHSRLLEGKRARWHRKPKGYTIIAHI